MGRLLLFCLQERLGSDVAYIIGSDEGIGVFQGGW